MRLAVCGITLGLPMFTLSLVDFLSLLWDSSAKIYFYQRYHLKDTYKIFEKIHIGLKLEWDL